MTFFILPPNLKVLKERLLNRHQGQEKLVEKEWINLTKKYHIGTNTIM